MNFIDELSESSDYIKPNIISGLRNIILGFHLALFQVYTDLLIPYFISDLKTNT